MCVWCENNTEYPHVCMVPQTSCPFDHEEADNASIIRYIFLVDKHQDCTWLSIRQWHTFLCFCFLYHMEIEKRHSNSSYHEENRWYSDWYQQISMKYRPLMDVTEPTILTGKAKRQPWINSNQMEMKTCGEISSDKKDLFAAGHHFFFHLYSQKQNNPQWSSEGKKLGIQGENTTINWLNFGSNTPPAHLKVMIWKSVVRNPPAVDMSKFGWKRVDGLLRPVVGVDEVAPAFQMNIIVYIRESDK